MANSGREKQAAEADKIIASAVRELQAGAGSQAFEPIYKHYYRPLYNFFANQPALRQEADDLAQETLIRALQNIEKYAFQASFGAWLSRIGENVWKNAVRKRKAVRRGGAMEPLAAVDEDGGESEPRQTVFSDEAPTPEQQVLEAERTRVLLEALEKLPPGMRRCAELRLGHDLKYQEIADVTGIGLNSVRSQLFEARKRLRTLLDRYFPEAEF